MVGFIGIVTATIVVVVAWLARFTVDILLLHLVLLCCGSDCSRSWLLGPVDGDIVVVGLTEFSI